MVVLVVGAGPAGLTYALRVLELDPHSEVTVLEEHQRIGYPVHCTGLVSFATLRREYPNLYRRAVLNAVRGAVVKSRYGAEAVLDTGRSIAAVLDREEFEHALEEEALKRGVRLKLGVRVTDIDPSRRKVKLANSHRFNFDLLVLATGASARLNSRAGLERPRGQLLGVNAEYEVEKSVDRDFVQVYFDSRIAPGFFAWAVPINEYKVRVGLAARSNPLERLRLLTRLDPFGLNIEKGRLLRVYGGVVLVGGPIRRFYGESILAVGDCAGHTKPTTGGGIAFLSVAARLAALATVFSGKASEAGPVFQAAYSRVLLSEQRLMLRARRILDMLDDKRISRLINSLKESGVIEEIGKTHMDFHGRTVMRLTAPSYLAKMGRLLLALLGL